MSRLLVGFGYTKRPVPKLAAAPTVADWAAKLVPFLDFEFGNIQKQIQGCASRATDVDTEVMITDGLILCDTTAGAIDVTWPTPLRVSKDWLVTVKRVSAGAFDVTLVGTFDGAVDPTLGAQYDSMTVWSDGTALHVIATV